MADEIRDLAALTRLMDEVRPRLHRYCARMVGSVFDGEDVLQEALAKATEALPAAGNLKNAEGWLFTIAHHAAFDSLRRRRRRAEVLLDDEAAELPNTAPEADSWAAAAASLLTLMQLPVLQRACVVLVDVLEYSLSEVVAILGASLPAVKAALHRGRVRLKMLAQDEVAPSPALSPEDFARLNAYAERFNARDFDTLRNLLADDVRLDVVNRRRLSGRKDVSVYFTRYSETADWKFVPGLAEGRPALLVSNPTDKLSTVNYVVLLDWVEGRITAIRDFHYARYVMDGLAGREVVGRS